MKPFNLEKAKAGKSVCTKDGKDVRIICFDRKHSSLPIIGLTTISGTEYPVYYTKGGCNPELPECGLFMKPEKKTGWINIYPNNVTSLNIYSKEEDAILTRSEKCVCTIKIEWEE